MTGAELGVDAGHAAEFLGFPIVGRRAAPGAGESGLQPGEAEAGRLARRTKSQHADDEVFAGGADVAHPGRIAVRAQVAFDKDRAAFRKSAASFKGRAELFPIGQIFVDARVVFVIRPQDQRM